MPADLAAAGAQEGVFSDFRWRASGEEWGRIIHTDAFRFADDAGAHAGLSAQRRSSRIRWLSASPAPGEQRPRHGRAPGPPRPGRREGWPHRHRARVPGPRGRSGEQSNILQYAYASMPLDDEAHAAAHHCARPVPGGTGAVGRAGRPPGQTTRRPERGGRPPAGTWRLPSRCPRPLPWPEGYDKASRRPMPGQRTRDRVPVRHLQRGSQAKPLTMAGVPSSRSRGTGKDDRSLSVS